MAAPLIGAVTGLATLGGTVAREIANAAGRRDPDPDPFRKAAAKGPWDDPYGAESEAAAGRVNFVSNPYSSGALGDQQDMRARQDAAMQALRSRAFGGWSAAGTQMDLEAESARKALLAQAGSQKGAYNPALAMDAERAAGGVRQLFSAPRAAMVAQERQRAQDALMAALQQQGQQDQGAFAGWAREESMARQQALAEQEARMGILQAGLKDKFGGMGIEDTLQQTHVNNR